MSSVFDKAPGKASKICFICIVMIYAIANFIIFLSSYILLADSSIDFYDIIENWQSKAIIDIQAAEDCDSGYEEALNYAWPGTYAGCWCGDVSTSTRNQYKLKCTVCQGTCNSTQAQMGCSSIPAYGSITLDAWGEVLTSPQKICVKHSDETWEKVAVQSGATCADKSLKKCGSNPENAFCTSKSQCPINNIEISTFKLTSNPSALTDCLVDSNCILLSQDFFEIKVLKYKRSDTYDSLPTAQIRINEHSMCSTTDQDNLTPGRKEFPLLKKFRYNCQTSGNYLWNPADTLTETKLFDQNGLTSTIDKLKRYGYYDSSSGGDKYTWGLFTRNYIPWSVNCRDRMQELIHYGDEIDSLLTYQLMVVIVAFIALICLGIILPVLLLQNLCCGNACCFKGKGKKERKRMKKFARYWTFVFMLVQAPFQILAVVNSAGAQDFIEDIVNYNCSHQMVLSTLSGLEDNLASVLHNDVLAIIILAVIALLSIGYFVYKKQKKHLKKAMKGYKKGKKKSSGSDSDLSVEMRHLKNQEGHNYENRDDVPQGGYYQAPNQFQYAPAQQPQYVNYAPQQNMGFQNQAYQVQYPQQYGAPVQQQYAPQQGGYYQQNFQQYPMQGNQQGQGGNYYQNQ